MWPKHGSKGQLPLREVIFAIPGDIDTPTGGYAYDRQVLTRLPAHRIAVQHLALPGSFPSANADDLAETCRLLRHVPEKGFC